MSPLVRAASFGLRPPRNVSLSDPTVPLTAAALLAAILVGVALAADLPIGIGLLIAFVYVPLVLVNLPVGLALWVPLAFLQGVPQLNLGGKAAAVLIMVAWVAVMRSSPEKALAVIRRHGRLLLGLLALVGWLTLSLAWADDLGAATEDLWPRYALVVIFVVTMTMITTRESLTFVVWAFVVGAILAVSIGVVDGSLTGPPPGSTTGGGAARIQGGTGDPNFLASSVVAAIVLAGGLMAGARSPLRRLALAAAIVILIAGLIGTASRGGMLAAAVTVAVALVVFRRRGPFLIAASAIAIAGVVLTFVFAPATWERVTNFDDDNGRSDLWYVAWEMTKENPVGGVGIGNFRLHISDYVQTPGGVEDVGLLVDRPHFVHNTYLQVLTDGGIVALTLFLGIVVACLRAMKQAADRFRRRGERSLETLAQCTLIATISMLVASIFLSAAQDPRLWLLLALGPALLTVARSAAEDTEEMGEADQAAPDLRPEPSPRPRLLGA